MPRPSVADIRPVLKTSGFCVVPPIDIPLPAMVPTVITPLFEIAGLLGVPSTVVSTLIPAPAIISMTPLFTIIGLRGSGRVVMTIPSLPVKDMMPLLLIVGLMAVPPIVIPALPAPTVATPAEPGEALIVKLFELDEGTNEILVPATRPDVRFVIPNDVLTLIPDPFDDVTPFRPPPPLGTIDIFSMVLEK
jgi:hypothetical protein